MTNKNKHDLEISRQKRRMEQYYVNSFQNANWFKKRKKIDSECYSEGLTCVILTKKNVQETQDIPTI